jgi:hypothetical protein
LLGFDRKLQRVGQLQIAQQDALHDYAPRRDLALHIFEDVARDALARVRIDDAAVFAAVTARMALRNVGISRTSAWARPFDRASRPAAKILRERIHLSLDTT